jgi:predicted DCC family thiol-disulfide oxidoreductase YuxK
MSTPPAQVLPMDHPILLFDGDCNFCRASVHWLVEHDRDGTLHYAPLQSPIGRELLKTHGVEPEAVESVILLDRGRVYEKSEASFEALGHIEGPWRSARILRRLPRVLRDFGYDRVSRNRPFLSRLFGTIDHRYEPSGADRRRFLAT